MTVYLFLDFFSYVSFSVVFAGIVISLNESKQFKNLQMLNKR